ncbi:MAPK kinase substrate protein At1g80180-like [Primulina eburnea]|uniref:MAPK kinase substrate protein At1g80180-like n=1 Tax=Primulina eburnea TaxID=1245227 RepID=UPI003C6C1558
MAGLQRSVVSFRRQGSSGLVWDEKLTQLVNQQEKENNKPLLEGQQDPAATVLTKNSPPPPGLTIERSRSNGGGRGFRTGRVSPAIEPPSPKVSACGLCSAFGKQDKNRRRLPPARPGKRVV